MTRKDYRLLAEVLAKEYDEASKGYFVTRNQGEVEVSSYTVAMVGQHLAKVLAADNPRFDTERFLKASKCGSK